MMMKVNTLSVQYAYSIVLDDLIADSYERVDLFIPYARVISIVCHHSLIVLLYCDVKDGSCEMFNCLIRVLFIPSQNFVTLHFQEKKFQYVLFKYCKFQQSCSHPLKNCLISM